MAFTIREFRDLIRVLETHPEWREELRRQVLTEEILSLPQIVRDLSVQVQTLAAQVQALAASLQQTQQEVRALSAEVQTLASDLRALSVEVRSLAAAQERTELELKNLAAAQRRTEERLDGLGEAIGRLNETMGGTVEEEAQSVLMDAMEKKGYHLVGEAFNFSLDGEVDVVQAIQDQAGRKLWALVEVKVRLGVEAVEAWANRMRSEGFRLQLSEAGISGPYLVYVFGLRVERRAFEAAEHFGIGLLRGRGEVVAPNGEIAGVTQE